MYHCVSIHDHPNAVRYTLLFGEAIPRKRNGTSTLPINVFKPHKPSTIARIKCIIAWYYGNIGFDDLPYWIKHAVRSYNITFKQREPSTQDMLDTIEDAREHRVINKELNLQDFEDYYKYGKRNIFSPL